MQQWWFGDGFGVKLVIYGVSLIFKVVIDILESENEIICISGNEMKGMYLTLIWYQVISL